MLGALRHVFIWLIGMSSQHLKTSPYIDPKEKQVTPLLQLSHKNSQNSRLWLQGFNYLELNPDKSEEAIMEMSKSQTGR